MEDLKALSYSVIKGFDSSDAINDYVESSDYGSVGYPKIAVAIILKKGTGNLYEYTIRTNNTNVNSPELRGRPVQPTQPSTKVLFNTFAKTAKRSCSPPGGTTKTGKYQNYCNAQYIYNGAISIQRVVNDWIMNVTGAQAEGYRVAENGV